MCENEGNYIHREKLEKRPEKGYYVKRLSDH